MKHHQFFVFVFSVLFTHTALAEYYVSQPTCGEKVTCVSCQTHHYKHKHKHKHHYAAKKYHHYQRNSYAVTVDYYYPAVSCGCSDTWVPGHCACGRWVPAHWQTDRDYVTFKGAPAGGYSYHETYYTDDRATADDTDADMQIN